MDAKKSSLKKECLSSLAYFYYEDEIFISFIQNTALVILQPGANTKSKILMPHSKGGP